MSIADELDKLSALQERGVITHEEFLKLKARLLDGELAPAANAQPETPLRRSRDDCASLSSERKCGLSSDRMRFNSIPRGQEVAHRRKRTPVHRRNPVP